MMAPSIADENYARSLSDGYGKPESKMTLCDVWLGWEEKLRKI